MLTFHSRYNIKVSQRYQMAYQLNDLALAFIFLIGSFLFFSEKTAYYGTWLFVLGSVQMFVRPLIAICHNIHISKIEKESNSQSSHIQIDQV